MKSQKKNNMNAYAISKYIRVSPVKIRRIIDLIKDRPANEALFLLGFIPSRSCRYIYYVLKAAIANSLFKYGKTANVFYISKAIVNEGAFLKRFQPHSQGRAFPIKKRSSHILILF